MNTNSNDTNDIDYNNWLKWIEENIYLNVDIDSIKNNLYKNGFNEKYIQYMIQLANYNIVDRRSKINNWILSVKSDLYNNINKITELNKLPSWDTFLQLFYSQNKPVIIKNALNKQSKNITIKYLYSNYDNFEIEIQSNRDNIKDKELKANTLKSKINFKDFLYKVNNENTNNVYMTANNNNNENIKYIKNDILSRIKNNQEPWSYLNNDNYDNQSFLWIGPKGTKTPWHYDLTNNLFLQIQGQKKFTLVPFEQNINMYNHNHVYTDIPSFDYNLKEVYNKFPNFSNVKPIEFIVNEGDVLFIPIGWWHKVFSLTPTISLSFTNFNARNDYSETYPN